MTVPVARMKRSKMRDQTSKLAQSYLDTPTFYEIRLMGKKRQRLGTTLHNAEIERFSHDGRGIVRINGKTTFIQGALPGEQVSFRYSQVKRDFDEGEVVSIISASASRVEPRCPHAYVCGGCSLQYLEEKAQIHEKQALLIDF